MEAKKNIAPSDATYGRERERGGGEKVRCSEASVSGLKEEQTVMYLFYPILPPSARS
jgi:hypothetical protein